MTDTKKNVLILFLGGLLIFGAIFMATRSDNANSQVSSDSNATKKLGELTFHTNLSYALEQAQSEKKMILIYGRSDICGWCGQFEAESFSDERITNLLKKKYILTTVDTVKQRSLAADLGIYGTPHVIFTTFQGQEIPDSRIPGYMDQESFFIHLNGLISNEE